MDNIIGKGAVRHGKFVVVFLNTAARFCHIALNGADRHGELTLCVNAAAISR